MMMHWDKLNQDRIDLLKAILKDYGCENKIPQNG